VTGEIERRAFVRQALGAVLAVSTLRLLRAGRALGAPLGRVVDDWIGATERLSAGLKQRRLTPRDWRQQMQKLYGRIPLDDLLRAADLDALARTLVSLDGPEPEREFKLPAPPGLDGFAFTTLLTLIRKGRAIVPHGHHNMVSMHLVLRGSVRLRQYDRVHDDATHLLIRPVADLVCGPGDRSAISADRGNVHWFQGLADSFVLIVGTYDLDPAAGPTGRDYVDPDAGEKQHDGSILAPRLSEADAYRRYLTL
jgi:hypothetical protein